MFKVTTNCNRQCYITSRLEILKRQNMARLSIIQSKPTNSMSSLLILFSPRSEPRINYPLRGGKLGVCLVIAPLSPPKSRSCQAHFSFTICTTNCTWLTILSVSLVVQPSMMHRHWRYPFALGPLDRDASSLFSVNFRLSPSFRLCAHLYYEASLSVPFTGY